MEKEEILLELRKSVPSAELPKDISFSINNEILYVNVKSSGVTKNMQNNSSAFEGWIFCIRSNFNNLKKTILDWEEPVFNTNLQEKEREERHYNRFLLRVVWFEQNYHWVEIETKHKDTIKDYINLHKQLVINFPTTPSEDKEQINEKDGIKKYEAILETNIYKILNTRLINSANHQLPVGLFDQKVSKETAVTPRGSSQIDIWQIENDIFRVFELKDAENTNNIQVGIISELMYYANIMNFLLKKHVITYPTEAFELKDSKYFRGFDLIISSIRNSSINKIEAVFLSERLHPLIYKNLPYILQDLNKNTEGILFRYEKVSILMKD